MAHDWGCKPWELTAEVWEPITPWQMYVWQARYVLYVNYVNEKRKNQMEQVRFDNGR